MNLSNDEKLMLAPILDGAAKQVTNEREYYLRSADSESQQGQIKFLTDKLAFIERMQGYCMALETKG